MQNSYCFALKSSSDKSKEQKALPLHRPGTFQGGCSLSRAMCSCLSWPAMDHPTLVSSSFSVTSPLLSSPLLLPALFMLFKTQLKCDSPNHRSCHWSVSVCLLHPRQQIKKSPPSKALALKWAVSPVAKWGQTSWLSLVIYSPQTPEQISEGVIHNLVGQTVLPPTLVDLFAKWIDVSLEQITQ